MALRFVPSGPGRAATVLRNGALVLLAIVTVVLCYLALTRDPAPSTSGDVGVGTGPATASGSAGGSPSGSSTDASPSAGATQDPPPVVPDQVNADFATSTALPGGARLYDNEQSGTPAAVQDGALSAGVPLAAGAASTLEAKLASDVQKVSATVAFPGQRPGSVVLGAWQQSLIDARQNGDPVPDSGLRLVVSRSGWALTEWKGGEITLDSGSFTPITGSAQVTIYRVGGRIWIVDPDGVTTRVRASVAAQFAGPYAVWQLREDTKTQTSAQILAVSAG